MLRNATIRPGEPPRPSRGRPRKDGTPAQSRTGTTTTEQEAVQDNQVQGSMPGSSDDHLRQPTTHEQDVIEPDIVMDAESLEVCGDKGETHEDDASEQGVRQIEEDEDVTVDEQRRRTVTSKQPARQSSPEDETSMASSKRQKREATIAAIKEEILSTVPEERPDLEQVSQFPREYQNNTQQKVNSSVAHGGDQQVEGTWCH